MVLIKAMQFIQLFNLQWNKEANSFDQIACLYLSAVLYDFTHVQFVKMNQMSLLLSLFQEYGHHCSPVHVTLFIF